MPEPVRVQWHTELHNKNISAAGEKLRAIIGAELAEIAAQQFHMHRRRIEEFTAAEILRECKVPLLPLDDPRVGETRAKMLSHVTLHPVLLVHATTATILADGHHRVSASFHCGSETSVACVVVHV